MVRPRTSRATAVRPTSKLKLFVAMNILPLLGIGFIALKIAQGELTLSDIERKLPHGTSESMICLLILFLALIVLTVFLLPLVNAICMRLRARGLLAREIRKTGSVGQKAWEAAIALPRGLVYMVFWTMRSVLLVASLGILVGFGFFTVRLMKPELGEGWLPVSEWLAKLR